jgi:hypothetical protein
MSESRFSWEMVVTGILLTVLAIVISDSNGNTNTTSVDQKTYAGVPMPEIPALPDVPNAPQITVEALDNINTAGLPAEAVAELMKAKAAVAAAGSIDGIHVVSVNGKNVTTTRAGSTTLGQYNNGILVKEDVFSSESIQKVDLNTVGGNIHISGGSGNQVRVRIIATGRDADIDKINDRYDVTLGRRGNEIVAEVKRKSQGLFSSLWNSNISMNIIVETPSSMQFNAQTSGGNIDASSISGNQVLRTSGGNVRLDALSGNGEIKTSGGNIIANDLDGTFDLVTSGGNIAFDRCSGAITAKTSGGNITLDLLNGSLDAKTSGGNIRATLHSVDQPVELNTSGGSISISLPETASCNLVAKASSVTIDKALNTVGSVKHNEVDVRLNDGGSLVNARTSAGSINITKLK